MLISDEVDWYELEGGWMPVKIPKPERSHYRLLADGSLRAERHRGFKTLTYKDREAQARGVFNWEAVSVLLRRTEEPGQPLVSPRDFDKYPSFFDDWLPRVRDINDGIEMVFSEENPSLLPPIKLADRLAWNEPWLVYPWNV